MHNPLQFLALAVGFILVGVALTLVLLLSAASRYASEENRTVEGCLSSIVVLLPLSLGGYLVMLGLGL